MGPIDRGVRDDRADVRRRRPQPHGRQFDVGLRYGPQRVAGMNARRFRRDVLRLISQEDRLHLHLDWNTVDEWLGEPETPLFLAWQDRTLVGAMADERIRVKPSRIEAVARALLAAVTGTVSALPESDGGTWVAAVARDLAANRETAELQHPGGPFAVALSRNGATLFAASPKSLRAWNVHGTDEKQILSGHDGGVPHVVFVSDACRSYAQGPPLSNVTGSVIFPPPTPIAPMS